jgi:hypothetical protein
VSAEARNTSHPDESGVFSSALATVSPGPPPAPPGMVWVPSAEATEHPDTLPESRMVRPVGGIRSPHGTLIPTYCANCGKKWGMVPERHITFAFVLCQECADKHGNIAHTYKEPDEVFWKRVIEAQLQEHGKILDPVALAKELDDPTTTMAKLAVEWQAYALKER